MKLEHLLGIATAVGLIIYFHKDIINIFNTNTYVPDPQLYRDMDIRNDYENMDRIVSGRVGGPFFNDIKRGWNIANPHPTYEDYLKKKYGRF